MDGASGRTVLDGLDGCLLVHSASLRSSTPPGPSVRLRPSAPPTLAMATGLLARDFGSWAAVKRQRQGGFLIAKIHQLTGRIFNRMLKENDITELNTAQGRIMFVLWRDDGIPISELAEKTGLEKSTLTSMLDRLEDAGLLRRTPSAEDRRKILIFRTEKDKSFEARYVQVSEEMTRLFYRGFAEEEITRFERDLERILDNLTSVEKER